MSQYRITGDAQEMRELIPEPRNDQRNVAMAFWSSPEVLAQHCLDTDRASCWHKSPWSNDQSFTDTKSMSEACELARNGWKDGAERASKLRDKVTPSVPVERRFATYGVAGAFPSIPRALAGNPMNMRRLDSAKARRKPVVTLISDMCTSGSVNSKCLTNRAAVVAAIIDAIESAGFACQVIGYASAQGSGVRWSCAVNLKDSDQPADIARLAFGLGHASMFRRLTWVVPCEDSFCEDIGGGLGQPVALNTDGLAERGIFVLESAQHTSQQFQSEDSAATKGLALLVNGLIEQGCPAFKSAADNVAA